MGARDCVGGSCGARASIGGGAMTCCAGLIERLRENEICGPHTVLVVCAHEF